LLSAVNKVASANQEAPFTFNDLKAFLDDPNDFPSIDEYCSKSVDGAISERTYRVHQVQATLSGNNHPTWRPTGIAIVNLPTGLAIAALHSETKPKLPVGRLICAVAVLTLVVASIGGYVGYRRGISVSVPEEARIFSGAIPLHSCKQINDTDLDFMTWQEGNIQVEDFRDNGMVMEWKRLLGEMLRPKVKWDFSSPQKALDNLPNRTAYYCEFSPFDGRFQEFAANFTFKDQLSTEPKIKLLVGFVRRGGLGDDKGKDEWQAQYSAVLSKTDQSRQPTGQVVVPPVSKNDRLVFFFVVETEGNVTDLNPQLKTPESGVDSGR
jgi:hypothetical protein